MRGALLLLATTARAVDPIRAHVITLDVYAPRYGDFLERNAHLVNDLQTWKPPVLFMPFNPIKTIVQNSIDVRLNRIYDEIDAFVLAPRPLAYTENDKTKSQVDPRNKWDPPAKGPTLTPGMNSEMRMGGVGGGGGGTGVDKTRAGKTTKASVDPHGGAASTAPSSTTSSQGYA